MSSFALSTRRKIQLAQLMHRAVRTARRAAGLPMQGQFRRSGLNWHLNLDEGIDFAIWLLGAFERDLTRFYRREIKPGDTVLDLGANIGAHTLPLADIVGPKGTVVAVEATEYAYNKLCISLALNPQLKDRATAIHALLVAAPDATADSHIYSSWPLAGSDTLHPVLGGKLQAVGDARVCTVDQLVADRSLESIDWVKMDVDGHELTVLQGAENTLRFHRPKIMMELAPYCHDEYAGQFSALVSFLVEIGYRFEELATGRQLPTREKDLLAFIPLNGSINVLASGW